MKKTSKKSCVTLQDCCIESSKTLESRLVISGSFVQRRRRRQCETCGNRFTTYENYNNPCDQKTELAKSIRIRTIEAERLQKELIEKQHAIFQMLKQIN